MTNPPSDYERNKAMGLLKDPNDPFSLRDNSPKHSEAAYESQSPGGDTFEVALLRMAIKSAGAKLKAAMLEGPDGPDCILTPAEATIVYRLLTETPWGMRL
jgi:hypothetical protein